MGGQGRGSSEETKHYGRLRLRTPYRATLMKSIVSLSRPDFSSWEKGRIGVNSDGACMDDRQDLVECVHNNKTLHSACLPEWYRDGAS